MDDSDSGNWLKSVFLKLILDRQMNEPTKICVLRVFFANEKSYVIFLLRNIQLIRHHEKDFLVCFFLSKCFIEDDFSHLYPIIFCPIGKYLF